MARTSQGPSKKQKVSSQATFKRGQKRTGKSFAAKVKKIIRDDADHKEVTTNVFTALNSTQAVTQLVNGVAEGVTNLTRIGKVITGMYIEVDLGIYNYESGTATAANSAGDFGFWAIVYDRQTNSGLATFANIFDQSNSGIAGVTFRKTTTFQDRFHIVAREEWQVGQASGGATTPTVVTGAQPYHIKRFIDLSKIMKGQDQKTDFNGTDATVSSIDKGNFIFCCAGTLCSATSITQVVGQVKYRYTDL